MTNSPKLKEWASLDCQNGHKYAAFFRKQYETELHLHLELRSRYISRFSRHSPPTFIKLNWLQSVGLVAY